MLETISWKDARQLAKAGDPQLLDIIDAISPDSKLPFIKARYPFGTRIKESGYIQLPNGQGQTEPLNGPNIDPKWGKQLGYNLVPLGLLVRNSVELFRELDDTVFSLHLAGPNTGIEMGIVEHFGMNSAYSVSSGARSLYMVPRISKQQAHKKLRRKYNIESPPPKRLMDQCAVFKELHETAEPNNPWYSEILYLPQAWYDHLEDKSYDWLRLKSYLQNKAWQHSVLGRRKVVFEILWQQAAGALTERGLKPNPYIVDTLKHLISISVGGISGFRPCNGDDFAGPINSIQQIYADTYGLGNQIPTIMRPSAILAGQEKPVYYSMQTPTMISSAPNFRSVSSNIEDMRELIEITQVVLTQKYHGLRINNLDINDILKDISFEYFHGEMYAYGKVIRPTQEMLEKDKELGFTPKSVSAATNEFAGNGAFIRGCVRISSSSSRPVNTDY